MEQEPVINAHNKEEYPPMHTGGTDILFKHLTFKCILCFISLIWCCPCQNSFAQNSDSVNWTTSDADIHQERIAKNEAYYTDIKALDKKIFQGGVSFDEACHAIPKNAEEILVLWGNNEKDGEGRGRRLDQVCFNHAMDNPRLDIIGRYFTAAYYADGHYGEIYRTDCYLIWKKHPQQTTAVLSILFDTETANQFLDMFEKWKKEEIEKTRKIERSSLWPIDTLHTGGSVADIINDKPLEGVKLELLREDDSTFVCSTTTDSNGKYGFSFPKLTNDDGTLVLFLLRITADGYHTRCFGLDMSMIFEYQSIIPKSPSKLYLMPIKIKEQHYTKGK